jgi:hypothetical protein
MTKSTGIDGRDLSQAQIDHKMAEATDLVGGYLASQTTQEQAHAAIGALRVSAVALLDATDAATAARVLQDLAAALTMRMRTVMH